MLPFHSWWVCQERNIRDHKCVDSVNLWIEKTFISCCLGNLPTTIARYLCIESFELVPQENSLKISLKVRLIMLNYISLLLRITVCSDSNIGKKSARNKFHRQKSLIIFVTKKAKMFVFLLTDFYR